MRKLLIGAVAALTVTMPAAVNAEGNLAAPPSTPLEINITGTAPTLSQTEFEIETGKYYRVVLNSDGAGEFMFSSPELLSNVHLRLVVIEDIEVHLQSMTFRGIEFDAGGTATFSFVPIRPGTYPFTIGDAAGSITVR